MLTKVKTSRITEHIDLLTYEVNSILIFKWIGVVFLNGIIADENINLNVSFNMKGRYILILDKCVSWIWKAVINS